MRIKPKGVSTRGSARKSIASKPLSDAEINYADIPPLRTKFWKNAVRGVLFPGLPNHPTPNKAQITMRLDQDVFAWLRGKGKGYQTRLNAMLRQIMIADQNHGRARRS